ncbi:MAG: LEPR-XLL domain-containing protein, partial [Gammaproteobacteria bacterium]|nr:LEPR-XLL domain-containing protein [Gammaproteobacteria bacterium]
MRLKNVSASIHSLFKRQRSQQVESLGAKRFGMDFESLEPRLLLSADFLTVAGESSYTLKFADNGSTDELQLYADGVLSETLALPSDHIVNVFGTAGADDLDFYINVDAAFEVAEAIELNFNLLGGDDTIELNDFDGLASSVVSNINFAGGDGDDEINVVGDLQLTSTNLALEAEQVDVEGAASIIGTGEISLIADSQKADGSSVDALATITVESAAVISAETITLSADAGALLTSALDSGTLTSNARAQIDVSGVLTASGKLNIDSHVNNSTDVEDGGGGLTNIEVVTSSTAIAAVHNTATLTADAMQITSTITGDVDVDLSEILTGVNAVTVTNITQAGIDEAATIEIGGAAVSMGEPASLLVQAIDSSSVDSQVSQDGILSGLVGSFDLSLISQTNSISRTIDAYIGTEITNNSVTPNLLLETNVNVEGSVKIEAQSSGGVTANIDSQAIGVALNTVIEATTASVKGSALDASGLLLQSTSSGIASATGVVSDNVISGDTLASIENSDLAIGSGGLMLHA